MMKTIETVMRAPATGHWVGDGFPVRSLFSYQGDTDAISPFLLLDYAGPYRFAPNEARDPRGVGQHPHRGFETVTIVYEGEVSHRDSTGGGGTIGAGDVQWMTAAGGIIHEEYHSPAFSKAGGDFRMVQLWVNLPAASKLTPAAYQAITKDMIPTLAFPGGQARVIAGAFDGTTGPATTHTPINMWDVTLADGAAATLPVPDGHNTLIVVLSGNVSIGGERLGTADIAKLSVAGIGTDIRAEGAAQLLVLTGEPIAEPVVGHGPFVMNSVEEIRAAVDDFNAGRFGRVAA